MWGKRRLLHQYDEWYPLLDTRASKILIMTITHSNYVRRHRSLIWRHVWRNRTETTLLLFDVTVAIPTTIMIPAGESPPWQEPDLGTHRDLSWRVILRSFTSLTKHSWTNNKQSRVSSNMCCCRLVVRHGHLKKLPPAFERKTNFSIWRWLASTRTLLSHIRNDFDL